MVIQRGTMTVWTLCLPETKHLGLSSTCLKRVELMGNSQVLPGTLYLPSLAASEVAAVSDDCLFGVFVELVEFCNLWSVGRQHNVNSMASVWSSIV